MRLAYLKVEWRQPTKGPRWPHAYVVEYNRPDFPPPLASIGGREGQRRLYAYELALRDARRAVCS